MLEENNEDFLHPYWMSVEPIEQLIVTFALYSGLEGEILSFINNEIKSSNKIDTGSKKSTRDGWILLFGSVVAYFLNG